MMAACHVSRHCFDNKSLTMASLLSCLCLFCYLLVWGERGHVDRSRVLVHTVMLTHTCTHFIKSPGKSMTHEHIQKGHGSSGQGVYLCALLCSVSALDISPRVYMIDCTAILCTFSESWSELGNIPWSDGMFRVQ